MEEKRTELKMIKMSEVQSQEIEWLWYPFIPYGKLTIVQGDPGDGKTTLILNIAAKLSKGEGLDNDMKLTEPMNIIYQTAEDGLADTVKPRLEKAGADCERIVVIDESDKSLSMADERLEEAIIQTGGKDNGCEAERNRAESKGFHSEVGEKSGTTKKHYYDRYLCVGASH